MSTEIAPFIPASYSGLSVPLVRVACEETGLEWTYFRTDFEGRPHFLVSKSPLDYATQLIEQRLRHWLGKKGTTWQKDLHEILVGEGRIHRYWRSAEPWMWERISSDKSQFLRHSIRTLFQHCFCVVIEATRRRTSDEHSSTRVGVLTSPKNTDDLDRSGQTRIACGQTSRKLQGHHDDDGDGGDECKETRAGRTDVNCPWWLHRRVWAALPKDVRALPFLSIEVKDLPAYNSKKQHDQRESAAAAIVNQVRKQNVFIAEGIRRGRYLYHATDFYVNEKYQLEAMVCDGIEFEHHPNEFGSGFYLQNSLYHSCVMEAPPRVVLIFDKAKVLSDFRCYSTGPTVADSDRQCWVDCVKDGLMASGGPRKKKPVASEAFRKRIGGADIVVGPLLKHKRDVFQWHVAGQQNRETCLGRHPQCFNEYATLEGSRERWTQYAVVDEAKADDLLNTCLVGILHCNKAPLLPELC